MPPNEPNGRRREKDLLPCKGAIEPVEVLAQRRNRREAPQISLRQRGDPLRKLIEHPEVSRRQLAFALHLLRGLQRAGQEASRPSLIDLG